jgi:hypothetical protein
MGHGGPARPTGPGDDTQLIQILEPSTNLIDRIRPNEGTGMQNEEIVPRLASDDPVILGEVSKECPGD